MPVSALNRIPVGLTIASFSFIMWDLRRRGDVNLKV